MHAPVLGLVLRMGCIYTQTFSDAQKNAFDRRFSDAERLHLLWLGYAEKMLAVQQPVAAAASMLNLHGCRCTVVRSKNVQHAGVHGIIIRVSGSMWHILQENDVCQHVDRRECDINFCIAPHSITLLAGQAQLNPTAL